MPGAAQPPHPPSLAFGAFAGTAYTFITPEEAPYAPDLLKALEQAKQEVPAELKSLADEFMEKVKNKEAKKRLGGYGGKGYKFDESELTEKEMMRTLQRKTYEANAGLVDVSEVTEEAEKVKEMMAEKAKVKAETRNIALATAAEEALPCAAILSFDLLFCCPQMKRETAARLRGEHVVAVSG